MVEIAAGQERKGDAMKGRDILKELKKTRDPSLGFIKWWRKENDFVDYELIENFLRDAREDQDFAGYELLTKEEMWRILKEVRPEGVELDKRRGEEVILWDRAGGKDAQVCPYTAASIMTIFDVETRGNVID